MAWFTLEGKKSKSTPTKKLSRGSPTIEALFFFQNVLQTFKKRLDKIERKWPGLIL